MGPKMRIEFPEGTPKEIRDQIRKKLEKDIDMRKATAGGIVINPADDGFEKLICPNCGKNDVAMINTLMDAHASLANRTTGQVNVRAEKGLAMGMLCMSCGHVLHPSGVSEQVQLMSEPEKHLKITGIEPKGEEDGEEKISTEE